MVRVLNVAEKPSAAKEIAQLLSGGRFTKRAGLSKYNHLFEFDMQLNNVGMVRMCVTSVAGHLKAVDFDGRFATWQGCDPEELFDAPIKSIVPDENAPIARTLEAEARLSQRLILWLDCDREGEHIAHEVMEVCLAANRALDVSRARFSAFIEREIVNAAQSPVAPNRLAADAVAARIELDLRIGAAFTRHQTRRLQRLEGLERKVVSYGPCQFPTLGFVVDQYARVASFVPEPFWYLRLTLRKGDQSVQLSWHRSRLYDQDACLALFERAQSVLAPGGAGAVVESMETRPTSKMRPLPLTTVELQKLASLKLNLSAETTMQVAEKLYNGGHLSYPRTETDQFQANFDLRGICELQRADPEWGAYAASLLDDAGKFVWPRAGRNNDQSHPPIHPTKPGGELSGVERALYELVARHLLACCSDDARGRQTSLVVRVGDDERFQAEGVMIDARNFLDVYKYVSWTARTLPVFATGERVQPEALEMLSGQTTAPLPLNEHDLISKMDEHGIGTDATIAQHIATIQRREYVTKNAQSRFIPTTLGVALIDGYKRFGYELEKPKMRAEMEQDMQAITRGATSRDDVVRSWVARYRDIFRTVVQQGVAFDAAFGVHFQRAPEQVEQETPAFSTCACGGPCTLRVSSVGGRREIELVCAACARKSQLGALHQSTLTATPQRCAHCNAQVLNAHNGATGTNMHICPQCYANPPAQLLVDVEDSGRRPSMPCFMCTHQTCTLARGHRRIDVRRCPTMCRNSSTGVGQLHMNTTENGRVTLSCDNKTCGYVIFLPRDVTRGVATKSECATCATAKPKRRSNLVTLTAASVGTVTTCISGCDQQLIAQLREANKPGVVEKMFTKQGVQSANAPKPPATATPAAATTTTTIATSRPAMPLNPRASNVAANNSNAASYRPAAPTRGTKRSISTDARPPSSAASSAACYRCQQVGHFAAQCPSQGGGAPARSSASAGGAPCFNCGQTGHWAVACPSGGGGGGGGGARMSAPSSKLVPTSKCECGVGTLIERVVSKEGASKGRTFIKCSNDCGVFAWK
jgi:DNA topoisomerase-3